MSISYYVTVILSRWERHFTVRVCTTPPTYASTRMAFFPLVVISIWVVSGLNLMSVHIPSFIRGTGKVRKAP